MDVIQIINEEISAALFEGMVWFHGTPDARELKQSGFSSRTNTTDYISDPQKWHDIQNQLQDARKAGNEDLYFQLLDQAGELRKTTTYKKPIYFTNKRGVANTYADPHRSMDYQSSEPQVLQVEINDSGNVLKVPAHGERFRGIPVETVRQALRDAGIGDDEINRYFAMFPTELRNDRMSADTLGIIAQLLGFDIVDVLGVLDSYHGGTTQSNVRMVFDPQRIKII
jgi:hypothetical protein